VLLSGLLLALAASGLHAIMSRLSEPSQSRRGGMTGLLSRPVGWCIFGTLYRTITETGGRMAHDVEQVAVITSDQLLAHWQGHRGLTRRMIEAFPEDQLFTFSIGGMRTFGDLALELLAMAAPTAKGLATGEWEDRGRKGPLSKAELLKAWDDDTQEIDSLWKEIAADRFQTHMTAFGQWPGLGIELLMYIIDNEIHHRGQAYVYLRALEVEPPAFYERGPWA